MLPEKPDAFRLLRSSRKASRPPPPPLGAARWDDAAPALCVVLAAHAQAVLSVVEVAGQLPDPTTLASGTLVMVLAHAETETGTLGRLFGGGKRDIPRALRCSALLAKGYTRIGAGADTDRTDLAWGFSP